MVQVGNMRLSPFSTGRHILYYYYYNFEHSPTRLPDIILLLSFYYYLYFPPPCRQRSKAAQCGQCQLWALRAAQSSETNCKTNSRRKRQSLLAFIVFFKVLYKILFKELAIQTDIYEALWFFDCTKWQKFPLIILRLWKFCDSKQKPELRRNNCEGFYWQPSDSTCTAVHCRGLSINQPVCTTALLVTKKRHADKLHHLH